MKEELFLTGHVEIDHDNDSGDIICEETGMCLSELLYGDKFKNKKVRVYIEEIE